MSFRSHVTSQSRARKGAYWKGSVSKERTVIRRKVLIGKEEVFRNVIIRKVLIGRKPRTFTGRRCSFGRVGAYGPASGRFSH